MCSDWVRFMCLFLRFNLKYRNYYCYNSVTIYMCVRIAKNKKRVFCWSLIHRCFYNGFPWLVLLRFFCFAFRLAVVRVSEHLWRKMIICELDCHFACQCVYAIIPRVKMKTIRMQYAFCSYGRFATGVTHRQKKCVRCHLILIHGLSIVVRLIREWIQRTRTHIIIIINSD